MIQTRQESAARCKMPQMNRIPRWLCDAPSCSQKELRLFRSATDELGTHCDARHHLKMDAISLRSVKKYRCLARPRKSRNGIENCFGWGRPHRELELKFSILTLHSSLLTETKTLRVTVGLPFRERQWTLGDIVNALLAAGLRLLRLEEHPDRYWDIFPNMLPELQDRLPHTFSL